MNLNDKLQYQKMSRNKRKWISSFVCEYFQEPWLLKMPTKYFVNYPANKNKKKKQNYYLKQMIFIMKKNIVEKKEKCLKKRKKRKEEKKINGIKNKERREENG